MSFFAFLIFVALMFGIFSQFGRRLAASDATMWWLVFMFLGVAILSPDKLAPVARLLGIELVSNLVLGGMVVILLGQVIIQSASTTDIDRKLRRAVSVRSAEKWPGGLPSSRPQIPGVAINPLPRLLVVLPCYNEEKNIPMMVNRLQTWLKEMPLEAEFCFVNDGSVDDSAKLLHELCPRNYVSHVVNVGVAGALMTGFRIALDHRFDYVVQCDSDGQHPVGTIGPLVELARREAVDLVVGSRFGGVDIGSAYKSSLGQSLESTSLVRWIGGRVISSALRLFGPPASISDPTSGFRVYSRQAIASLIKQMPDEYPEPETIALVSLAGLKVKEARVTMSPRVAGTSSISSLKAVRFMIKVTSALVGLRLRTLLRLPS